MLFHNTKYVASHHVHLIYNDDICNFRFSMTLLGSRRIDKYPHIRMWNVVCTAVGMEHKQSVVVPIVADNNTFLLSVWKCYVMYFPKKVFPLLNVHVKTCNHCGFSIMEWNFCCSWFNCIIERFVSNVCFKSFDLIFISYDCLLIVGNIVSSVLWYGSRYEWSSNISWKIWLRFSTSKRF